MIIRVVFGIFMVAAFLCFPMPYLGLGPFLSMLMSAYLAAVVAAIFYLQSTMICRTYKYTRTGKLGIADKEKLLPIILLVLLVVFSTYHTLFYYNYGVAWMFPFFIIICFLFVLAEELIFRNFLFYVFIKQNVKVHHSVLICSILFACMHTFRYINQGAVFVMCYHFVFAFSAGIILGALFVISRNLLFVTIINFLIRVPIFGYALQHTGLAGKKIDFLLQVQFTANRGSMIWFSIYLITALLVAAYYYRVLVRHYANIDRLRTPNIVLSQERLDNLTSRYGPAKKDDSSSMFF